MNAILSLFLTGIFLAQTQQGSPKSSPPPPAELVDAEKLIKEVFKDEYAKRSATDRQTLAKKLLSQASQTKDDPKSQFVLLREARDLAGQAGDIATAVAAVDEMAKHFVIDALGMKNAVLSTAVKSAKTPDDFKAIASLYLKFIDAALQADDYDAAEKFAASATQHSKKSQEMPLINRAAAKTKEVVDLKGRYEKLKKAKETLATNPDDGLANLLLGRFQCFTKANWEGGLALLAKGSDSTLKTLAQNELAKPVLPADQVALGDGWWDQAEKEGLPAKDILRDHAASWYVKALPKLSGLNKTKAEKRVSEFRTQRLAKGNWMDVTDPKLFGLQGKAGDPLEVTAKPTFVTSAKLTPFPKGEFDGISVRVTLDPSQDVGAWVLYETPRHLAAFVDAGRSKFVNARLEAKSWKHEFETNWAAQNESIITILLIDGEYVIHLDARELTRVKTLNSRITHLTLEAWSGAVKFDRIQLRRAE